MLPGLFRFCVRLFRLLPASPGGSPAASPAAGLSRMDAQQAVERYVTEILRVVGQRAKLEVEVVEAAKRRVHDHPDNDLFATLVGEIATKAFRRELWRGSRQ